MNDLTFINVDTLDDLLSFPDGSLVVWQRIPGDGTSTAVAFLHHQTTMSTDPDDDSTPETIHWLSPGGWHPQDPAEVIKVWPVQVLIERPAQDGEAGGELPSSLEPLSFPERTDEDYRDRALLLSAMVAQARPQATTKHMIDRAREFEDYLRGVGEGQQ
ncbi:hypothetical protein SEA_YAGO84_51 [Gordonia phage Yago84]|nr:hypothetical protein SEA_YAGO84_51 [Gordonia phage Yago84]QIG58979.1 hypothetical protein SEA_ANCLAR_52 [Gordonia phage AnClar]WIC90033.1 hypothetical protein SEA_SISKO_51 [Gordonia phage Sisko]